MDIAYQYGSSMKLGMSAGSWKKSVWCVKRFSLLVVRDGEVKTLSAGISGLPGRKIR